MERLVVVVGGESVRAQLGSLALPSSPPPSHSFFLPHRRHAQPGAGRSCSPRSARASGYQVRIG